MGQDWGLKPGLGLHSALPAQLCQGRRTAAPGPGLAGAPGTFCFPQQKSVSRRKCAACKIVVHTPCIEQLEKVSVAAQAFPPLPLGAPEPRGAHIHSRSRHTNATGQGCLSACGCEKAAVPAFAPRLPLLLLLCPRCPEQA